VRDDRTGGCSAAVGAAASAEPALGIRRWCRVSRDRAGAGWRRQRRRWWSGRGNTTQTIGTRRRATVRASW